MTDGRAPTRSAAQRAIGARYDELHALLVRVVHPAAFGAFFLTIGGLLSVIGYVFVHIFSDSLELLFVVAIMAVGAIVVAFSFALTRVRAIVGLVLVTSWAVGLSVVDEVHHLLLWAIWVIAGASVVIQAALLARVVPRRFRAGLTHLLLPATVGTFLGAAPVVLGIRALVDGDEARSRSVAVAMFLAAIGVLLVLLLIDAFVRWRDVAIARDFAVRHQLRERPSTDEPSNPKPIARLVPEFGAVTPVFQGRFRERQLRLCTGCTIGTAPDVPTLHLTVLAMKLDSTGPDLWVRRRGVSHDNLLVGTDHAGVLRLESISFDERWSVRFDAEADAIESRTTFGPQLIDLLDRSLGDGQVCRMGGHAYAWIVGGARSADELDVLVETLHAFARIVEGHTPTRSATAGAAPA